MSWFRRKDQKINQLEKKSIPDGLWEKCPTCSEIVYRPELEKKSNGLPPLRSSFSRFASTLS